jgi:hypothetical protein
VACLNAPQSAINNVLAIPTHAPQQRVMMTRVAGMYLDCCAYMASLLCENKMLYLLTNAYATKLLIAWTLLYLHIESVSKVLAAVREAIYM